MKDHDKKNISMMDYEKRETVPEKEPVEVEEKVEAKEKELTVDEAIQYIAGKIPEEEASDALKRLAQAVLDGSWFQSTR